MLLERRSPKVIYSIDTRERAVALTLDDGPDSDSTPKILELLQEEDVPATFFLISSRVPGNEDLVQRMVEEGHEIANHMTYDIPSIFYSPASFEKELLSAHETLSSFSEIYWFRPASGWYSPSMLATLDKHQYRCALGSVYPFDAKLPSAEFAKRYILWRVHPGSIIVLHDNGTRGERALDTLRVVLPELKDRGFSFLTLSELVDLEEGK